MTMVEEDEAMETVYGNESLEGAAWAVLGAMRDTGEGVDITLHGDMEPDNEVQTCNRCLTMFGLEKAPTLCSNVGRAIIEKWKFK